MNTSAQQSTQRLQRIVASLSVILIAISIFFRIWHLSNIPGLNGDEAIYGADSIDLLKGRAIDWHTPNGNLKNIFYYAPVLLLHAIFPQSVVLLRTTAVICGMAAIALNYVLCRRIFGQNSALLSSVLIAVLPENIAESRFGWDPCESLLIDLLVVYGSLAIVQNKAHPARLIATTTVACVIAFVVHPSNLFSDIFLPIAIIVRFAPDIAAYFTTGNKILRWSIVATVAMLVICAGLTALKPQLAMASKMRGAYTRGFVLDYAALFSGRSTYKYVAGYPRPYKRSDFVDVLSVLPWLFCAGYAARVLSRREKTDNTDRLLAAGWLLEIAAYAAIGGARNLEPLYVRYGLCMIVPGVWLFVRALEHCCASRPIMTTFSWSAVLALSALLLICFYNCYFRYIMTTGGTAEEALRTAPMEPKVTAIHCVLSECPQNEPCYILCSKWWNYQPARYYSMGRSNIRVLMLESAKPADVAACLQAMRSGHVWTIDFISDRSYVRKVLAFPGIQWTVIAVPDYGGKPIVIVGHPVLPSGRIEYRKTSNGQRDFTSLPAAR